MSVPSPVPAPVRRLGTSALTESVDDSALTAFIADSKAKDQPWRRITTGLPRPGISDVFGQLVPALVPLVGLTFFLYVGGTDLLEAAWHFTWTAPFPLNLVIVGFVALIAFGIVVAGSKAVALVRSLVIPRSWWEAAYRLTRFAAANDLHYGHDDVVAYPGVIFSTGIDRTAERRLTTTAGRRVEIGNYRYTVPSEDRDSSRVYGWGYVAITLDRRLPHLLLDAKANDKSVFGIRTSNLPVELAKDQRLSLGGEFDDAFTLYAPVDYGRDAFQIFAPDLMALFLDRLGAFDVEIVDDSMFVYGGRFDLLDPTTYDWLQELVATVVARTVHRTSRYSDDFALLETDPAATQPTTGAETAPEELSAGQGDNLVVPLLTGVPLGAVERPGTTPAVSQQQVFTLGGDGPPVTAGNTVAGRGRRLRARRWGLASVVGLLLVAFYLYDTVVAPLFGLPTLGE